MIKIPYAVRDFEKLITEGFRYLDRTDRIPRIEELGYELLFLRPRRFGKSLWLSTLMNYYDKIRMEKKKVTGQELRQMAHTEIVALEAVKSKLDEAKAQLRDYQQALQKKVW